MAFSLVVHEWVGNNDRPMASTNQDSKNRTASNQNVEWQVYFERETVFLRLKINYNINQ